jgi:hypothetical protein
MLREREREREKSLKFHKKTKEIETRMNALYKTRKRTMFLERKGEGKKERKLPQCRYCSWLLLL